jgi:hypothetical protein
MADAAPALDCGNPHGAEEASPRAFIRSEAYDLLFPDGDKDGDWLVTVADGNLVSPSGLKISGDEIAHARYLVTLRPPQDDARLSQFRKDGLKGRELQQIDEHIRHFQQSPR